MKRVLLYSFLALVLIPSLALASAFSSVNPDLLKGPNQSPGTIGDIVRGTFYDAGGFDCVLIGAVHPDFLPPTVVSNFSVGGWSQAWASNTTAVFGGPTTTSLEVDIAFAENVVYGDSYLAAGYLTGTWLGAFEATWTQDGWVEEASRFGYDGKPTPEPATWMALIAGLGVLGVTRFRTA